MELTPEQKANAKVREYIVHLFKTDSPYSSNYTTGKEAQHLRQCGGVSALPTECYDSTYGCDTGCEYVRLEAVVFCYHGVSVEYEYGDFGDLADMLGDMGLTDN